MVESLRQKKATEKEHIYLPWLLLSKIMEHPKVCKRAKFFFTEIAKIQIFDADLSLKWSHKKTFKKHYHLGYDFQFIEELWMTTCSTRKKQQPIIEESKSDIDDDAIFEGSQT